ncbi:MAG: peptide/nickel transport system ATP-binding protein [Gaiellales bacterium]|jgi:peptide/nickel transport system ATP-binding protein|nr:peptide/nickel transport system ATP-binding protein [Gaiellales bacterium]
MALLEVEDLVVRFHTRAGPVLAVNGVSFDVDAGQTIGVVGESGSGKSVTSLAVMGMLPGRKTEVTAGGLMFDGEELLRLSKKEMRRRRGSDLAMVFQNPTTSLNPVVKIGKQITEALVAHERIGRSAAARRAEDLLDRVGVPDPRRVMGSYPHRLSGGLCQRVMIAVALALRPKLLIADEPTTALDVTIQAQVLEVLRELTRDSGTALILITHDLGVVAAMTERVNVMYAGRIVETATTPALFHSPRHPYTVGLIRSVARSDRAAGKLVPIPGQPPDLLSEQVGCPFEPRCEWRLEVCRTVMPPLVPEQGATDHLRACHNPVHADEVPAGRPLRVAATAGEVQR